MRFAQWLVEKKKSSKESMPPTAVSSPLRGQNQDYNGTGVKHDVADYTISDEKLAELSPELVGKVNKIRAFEKPSKTVAAADTLRRAVKKAFLNSGKKPVNEIVSGVGDIRSTPVNISSTPRSKSSNAPASSSKLQHSADSRRIALDKQAQQQKDEQEKQRVQQEKQRQQQAAKRVVQTQAQQQNKSVQ